MRLLYAHGNGELRLTRDFHEDEIPPYVILSHTWGADKDEVAFSDLQDGSYTSKPGYTKLQFCAQQARADDVEHFWVDTCCIDKANHSELSEAIISMFHWYRNAAKCVVYLSDVSVGNDIQPSTNRAWETAFLSCRWFTRGWTLLELLAPASVEFFSREGRLLGSKLELEGLVHKITGIPVSALRGTPLLQFSVDERMQWAESRITRREEDKAYSLMGILDIYMPPMYGEGNLAISRLKREIKKSESRLVTSHRLTCEDCQLGQDMFDIKPGSRSPLRDRSFALLSLIPGTMGDMIEGHMHEFSLSSPPLFYALSYVWGQEPPVQPIRINGKPTFIQPNLFHALQRIRLSEGSIRIWVDALSINQEDSSERNAQVRQMADIYGKDDTVMIWLGEGDSTSNEAMDLVPRLCSDSFAWSHGWWDSNDMSGLNRLMERPWFQRGWVLQEAACSTNAIILCGDKQIQMDSFAKAINLIQTNIDSIRPPMFSPAMTSGQSSILKNFHDLPAVRFLHVVDRALIRPGDGTSARRGLSLESLVELTTFSETTDHRDAIYALLNLANNATVPSLTNVMIPDYRKPVLDVFVDFILHCCCHSGSLDIICRPWAPVSPHLRQHIGLVNSGNHNLNRYPSWIATKDKLPFGNPSRRFTQRLNGKQLVGKCHKMVYNTHFGTTPHVSVGRKRDGTCDGSLRVRGLILGKVAERSTRFGSAIIGSRVLKILGSVTREPDSNRINLPDRVWRTLCADRDENGDPAPRVYHLAMLDLLRICSQAFSLESDSIQTTDVLDLVTDIDVDELLDSRLDDHVQRFLRAVRAIIWDRRIFKTRSHSSGLIPESMVGLIPRQAAIGDYISILYGCSVPVVLRMQRPGFRMDNSAPWELVGEAYVFGAMDGEVIRSAAPETLRAKEVEFTIG